MIIVSPSISLDESELNFTFIRSSGPGGQNVNKVSTAVQLRFNVSASPSLPLDVKERLIRLAGKRMTQEGELIIDARSFRTQARNRVDALDRLTDLIRRAEVRPVARRKSRPSPAAQERRLEAKKRHSQIKRTRTFSGGDD